MYSSYLTIDIIAGIASFNFSIWCLTQTRSKMVITVFLTGSIIKLFWDSFVYFSVFIATYLCPINCRNFTWIILWYTFWEKKCIIILCQWLKVIYSALSKKIYYIHLFLCTLHDVFFVVLYFLSLPIKCPNIMTKRQRIKWQEEKIIIFGSFFKRKIIYMKKHIEEYFFSIQDLQNPFLFKVISLHPYEVFIFMMIAIRVDM